MAGTHRIWKDLAEDDEKASADDDGNNGCDPIERVHKEGEGLIGNGRSDEQRDEQLVGVRPGNRGESAAESRSKNEIRRK